MAGNTKKIDRLENTLKTNLNPVFAMAGIANPVAAAVMFGLGILFRFVRLGAQVRQQNEAAGQALEAAVRAEGIFRIPVEVNLRLATVINFVRNDFALLYPIAYHQLEPERKVLRDKSDPAWKEALATLELAYRVLPDVYFDLRFDGNPVLDDLFGKWLDPGDPDFGGLLRQLRTFTRENQLSVPGLQAMLPTFVRQRLEATGVDVAALTEEQLTAATDSIGDVVKGALAGEEGLLQETLSFAVNKRKEGLEGRLEELGRRRDDLRSKAESDLTLTQFKELEQINQRIKDTETMLGRISELA